MMVGTFITNNGKKILPRRLMQIKCITYFDKLSYFFPISHFDTYSSSENDHLTFDVKAHFYPHCYFRKYYIHDVNIMLAIFMPQFKGHYVFRSVPSVC